VKVPVQIRWIHGRGCLSSAAAAQYSQQHRSCGDSQSVCCCSVLPLMWHAGNTYRGQIPFPPFSLFSLPTIPRRPLSPRNSGIRLSLSTAYTSAHLRQAQCRSPAVPRSFRVLSFTCSSIFTDSELGVARGWLCSSRPEAQGAASKKI
jgi:hypothetical protein